MQSLLWNAVLINCMHDVEATLDVNMLDADEEPGQGRTIESQAVTDRSNRLLAI